MCAWRPDPIKDKEFLMKHKDAKTGKPLMQVMLENKSTKKAPKLAGATEEVMPLFGNKKVLREGKWWDSEWEYFVYLDLRECQKRNYISDLETQVTYKFIHNDVYITRIKADFAFTLLRKHGDSIHVVADAKSHWTAKFQRFRVQKNLMRAFYNREIMVFYKNDTNVQNKIKDLFNSMDILLKF